MNILLDILRLTVTELEPSIRFARLATRTLIILIILILSPILMRRTRNFLDFTFFA